MSDSVFPLPPKTFEDHPDTVAKLEGVDPKYFETAEEKNRNLKALIELDNTVKVFEATSGNYSLNSLAAVTTKWTELDAAGNTPQDGREAIYRTDLGELWKWNSALPAKAEFSRIWDILTQINQKVNITDVQNVLTSTDATKPLSANQGKILKDFIDAINNILTSDDTTLDELQEVVTFIKQNKTDLQNLAIANIAGLVEALALKADKTEIPSKTTEEDGAFLTDENGNAFVSFLDGIGFDTSKISTSFFNKILTLLNIAQELGDSETRPISQAAFTTLLAENTSSTKETIEDGAFFCNEKGEVFTSFINGVSSVLGLEIPNTPTINAIEDIANVLGGTNGQYLKKNSEGKWEGSTITLPTQNINSLTDVDAPYTEGALLQMVGGKIVPATISLEGVVTTDSRVGHPLYGKHFFVFGDSHTEAPNLGWWQKVCELTGGVYHTIFKQQVSIGGGETELHFFCGTLTTGTTIVDEVDMGIVPNCADVNWAQYAHVASTFAIENSFNVDYILVQNSHFSEWGFYENDDSLKENVPLVLLNPTKTYSQIFANASEASSFISQDSNVALVVSELGFTTIDSSFNLRYGTATQELTFTFSSGTVLDIDVTIQIYFGSDSSNFISVNLTSGMTISEVTDAINQWEFSDISTWTNPTKGTVGNTSIVLNYDHSVGGDGDSLATLNSFSSNLQLTAPVISTGYANWVHLYGLKDTAGLNLSSSWIRTGGNVNWSLPNTMLGALQYMGENSPTTKFVFVGVPNNSFDSAYVYADGSINPYDMMKNSAYINGEISRKSSKDIAEFFGCQYIDINKVDGVSAFNVYPTFNSLNDVHNKTIGYELWGEIVAKYIK